MRLLSPMIRVEMLFVKFAMGISINIKCDSVKGHFIDMEIC